MLPLLRRILPLLCRMLRVAPVAPHVAPCRATGGHARRRADMHGDSAVPHVAPHVLRGARGAPHGADHVPHVAPRVLHGARGAPHGADRFTIL